MRKSAANPINSWPYQDPFRAQLLEMWIISYPLTPSSHAFSLGLKIPKKNIFFRSNWKQVSEQLQHFFILASPYSFCRTNGRRPVPTVRITRAPERTPPNTSSNVLQSCRRTAISLARRQVDAATQVLDEILARGNRFKGPGQMRFNRIQSFFRKLGQLAVIGHNLLYLIHRAHGGTQRVVVNPSIMFS